MGGGQTGPHVGMFLKRQWHRPYCGAKKRDVPDIYTYARALKLSLYHLLLQDFPPSCESADSKIQLKNSAQNRKKITYDVLIASCRYHVQ